MCVVRYGLELKRFALVAACALICTVAVPSAWAQADADSSATELGAEPSSDARQPAQRPAIGLVLSGGGARGGAHLGVIKALEELRVPIDYIAGTSIGAAIGGIYAAGLSVEELEAFLSGIDWDAAFFNTTPRKLRSFRRKRDDDLFLVEQRPGLNDGEFQLPTGVVQGQIVDLIMARVTLPVADVEDFDELAIPYRAVAADLETGEAVILGSGDLGRSIRASMSVPAAFAPMELDGRLLVDGGIVMNLPVQVAKDMGADRIIAVDISEPLSTRDEIQSVVDVTSQLTSLLTQRGTTAQRALLTDDDILLRPELSGDYSSVNFSRITETIDAGYQLVMANRAQFEPYAMSPAAYAAYRSDIVDPRAAELPTIDFVRLNNQSPIADSVIRARLEDIEIGVPLDVDVLEASLNRVYGLEIYQNVRYELVDDGEMHGLEIGLTERSWGPNYLQLGVQYSSASEENAVFGLAASYLQTAINDLGGEWRGTFFLGDEPGFLVDLYQPLGRKALYFVAPILSIKSNLLNLYSNNELAAELKLRTATLEIGLGREMMDWAEFRAGVRTGYGETRLRVGDAALVPFDDYRSGEFFARFSIDTLDDISFPSEGVFMQAEWRGSRTGLLSPDAEFDQLLVSSSFAKTWGRHTLLTRMRYDTTISDTAPLYGLFEIGGFLDLSGLNSGQISGQHVARLGATYYRRIGDLALFPAFAGVSIEAGNAWDRRSDISSDTTLIGGSLWAGVDTPVGPVYLGYGFAEGGENAFYVVLGRVF